MSPRLPSPRAVRIADLLTAAACAVIAVVGLGLIAVWLTARVPPGSARVFVAALTASWICVSLSTYVEAAFVAAPTLGLLAAAALSLELPLHPNWGDRITFEYAFPHSPPYIGQGGRLRPRQSLRMAIPTVPGASVLFETNTLGFRNHDEVTLQPLPGRYRVLNLGDSFSIGYGVDQDRFFGSVLQWELVARGLPAEVLNAEVSDPAYGLYYLQHEGVTFSPDLVIYGLCGNDPLQTFLATATNSIFTLEADGTLRANPGATDASHRRTWNEWQTIAYRTPGTAPPATNRLGSIRMLRVAQWMARLVASGGERSRRGELTASSDGENAQRQGRMKLFDGYNNVGNLVHESLGPAEQMYAHLFPVVAAMAATAQAHGAEFLLLLYPPRMQVQPRDWQAMVERWQLDASEFDLDKHHRRIMEFCRQGGIDCLDLAPTLRRQATRANLYLPYDEHFGEAGHAAVAHATAAHVGDHRSRRPQISRSVD